MMKGVVPQPAIHTLPVHATDEQLVGMIDVPRPVQVVPLNEYASVLVPAPPAIHMTPVHAIALHWVEKMAMPPAVHVVPLVEYASVLVPEPPAIK
jgi:hypothetical protein